MGSVLLSTLYSTVGSATRPLTWYKHTGHFLSKDVKRKEFAPPINQQALSSYPLTATLIQNACDINPSNVTRKSPLKVVLADKYGEYTTDDILTNSLRLAYALSTECKVKPRDRVAIMTMPEREMLESFFAIQAVGAVPIPINFVNKPKTIAYMLADSGAKTLIVGTDERLVKGARKLANLGFLKNVISVRDNVDSRFYNYSDLIKREDFSFSHFDNLKHPIAKDPSVIFYTSGTGSAPRGIVIPYENVADGASRTTKRFPFAPDDVMFFPVPFYHIAGFISFVGAMNAGIKIVLSDIPRYKEPESIQAALDMAVKNKITIFPCAPMIAEAVLEKAIEKNQSIPSLRTIISGGAPITKKLVSLVNEFNARRRAEKLPDVELINFYAATEFGPISSNKVDLTTADDRFRKSLGIPFDGVEVRNNSRGLFEVKTALHPDHYLNRPELSLKTEDDFIIIGDKIDISTTEPKQLFYCGRDRGSINVYGNEVSLENVQEELLQLDIVGNACVFGITDEISESQILCALVVPANGKEVSVDEIDAALEKKQLPKRLRPTVYVFEKYFPIEVINGSSKPTPRFAEAAYEAQAKNRLNLIRAQNTNIALSAVKPFALEYHLAN